MLIYFISVNPTLRTTEAPGPPAERRGSVFSLVLVAAALTCRGPELPDDIWAAALFLLLLFQVMEKQLLRISEVDYLEANMKQELRSWRAGMLRMWQNHTMAELHSSRCLLSWGHICPSRGLFTA